MEYGSSFLETWYGFQFLETQNPGAHSDLPQSERKICLNTPVCSKTCRNELSSRFPFSRDETLTPSYSSTPTSYIPQPIQVFLILYKFFLFSMYTVSENSSFVRQSSDLSAWFYGRSHNTTVF